MFTLPSGLSKSWSVKIMNVATGPYANISRLISDSSLESIYQVSTAEIRELLNGLNKTVGRKRGVIEFGS